MKINTYFAHPAFTPSQVEFKNRVKSLLNSIDVLNVVDPFDLFPNMESHPKKKDFSNAIFKLNKTAIQTCDLVIAIIDDRDPGVFFELGYADALDKTIITISDHDYNNNIMIEGCVTLHIREFSTQNVTSMTESIRSTALGSAGVIYER